jgi:SAM-dependent methyltransferase
LLGQLTQRPSFWHEVRASAVIERVPVDRPAVVADLGAGAGLLGEIVRRDRPRSAYRFYEPIDALAGLLTERHGGDARLADIAAVRDADLVTLLDVVEHVEDDRALVAEIVQAMRPGATLVVTVPALPLLWSPWDEALGHHRRYTRATLRSLAAGLPLAVDEVSFLFPELLPPALVRRVARGRVGRDRDARIAEFPNLPRVLDRALRYVSGLTYRCRRWWPAGTSLLLVAHRS